MVGMKGDLHAVHSNTIYYIAHVCKNNLLTECKYIVGGLAYTVYLMNAFLLHKQILTE